MEIIPFIVTVISISTSGVLMPGPLFATAISEGKHNKYAGFFLATGHALVEVPLIIILFYFGGISLQNRSRALIGIVGGLVMFYFASSTLRKKDISMKPVRGLVAGIAFSSLNPFFIMWWLTIGLSLAVEANTFGIPGLFAFIFFHELCDYGWYGFISFSSEKGMRIHKIEKLLKLISVSILFIFAGFFVLNGITALL
jgi:threonine/homoserine/homoserine lactone efflux protein